MYPDDRAQSVLIVEDERIVAKDIQQTLAGFGYDAFAIASSAEEAFARASEKCPDVVLMDIRIKGPLDGIAAAELLRGRFDVPIVYLTAHADETTIGRAKKTEPHGYLLKPVKSAELRSAVEVSLYRHAMEKRLRERERWFSTTLRSIADAVIAVDASGNVTFMNPAAESVTATSAADAAGRPARDVLRMLDDQGRLHTELPLERALREQRPVDLPSVTLEGPSGRRRLISDRSAPVIDDGTLLGAVMVFREVAERN